MLGLTVYFKNYDKNNKYDSRQKQTVKEAEPTQ